MSILENLYLSLVGLPWGLILFVAAMFAVVAYVNQPKPTAVAFDAQRREDIAKKRRFSERFADRKASQGAAAEAEYGLLTSEGRARYQQIRKRMELQQAER